jgi:D-sedoheptulose 7-phosphate isomerase
MRNKIIGIMEQSIATKRRLLEDASYLTALETVAGHSIRLYQQGGKILFCGNGGSAADAQHIAAELSGRFYKDRAPLYAEALHVNSSYLTAVANDYGYEAVFARMVSAAGRPGDMLIALSTSGNAPNVIRAAETAKALGMLVIGMTGAGGGQLAQHCDILLAVPSTDTPRIQECHILTGHILCELIEEALFGLPEGKPNVNTK